MTKNMLIDAAHPDETRVVIADDDFIEDFDFVTTSKKQVKGNIYLAKITRVEPSLQAAFVEYGGGKQGFLPFAEIHPDYYQIPMEDKKRLIEEEAEETAREEEEEEQEIEQREARQRNGGGEGRHAEGKGGRRGRRRFGRNRHDRDQTSADAAEGEADALTSTALDSGEHFSESEAAGHLEGGSGTHDSEPSFAPTDQAQDAPSSETDLSGDDETTYQPASASVFEVSSEILSDLDSDADEGTSDNGFNASENEPSDVSARPRNDRESEEDEDEDQVETVSSDDMEETRVRRRGAAFKRYRIQEVIKRNQIVLVQVIKEERGNKGVSLTTYISLAGRYCVLMPNSPKAGGVSRKIGNGEQRKKLKEVVAELKDSRGLSAIIRTAGIDRTKPEIKRDYDYLVKLWQQIREDTMASVAPAMIYEESDIIKRAIRDLYTSDVEHILVQGDDAYKDAKNFMKLIMPSHAPRVKQHKEALPIFSAYGVEEQLASMHEPSARLASGGYIVLQQTEALISIDVNSGRSTTERNVEETAIKTNLEAAREVARQLRLRDLAGLIVVDFIDMYYGKNKRTLERAMKDALKHDRAKIQVSRISAFGLMEISRQRLRPSIAESSTITCPHCEGTGTIRSVETVAIQIIRTLEREAASGEFSTLKVYTNANVVLHLFNHKRHLIEQIEQQGNLRVVIEIDTALLAGSFRMVKVTHDGKEIHHQESDRGNKRKNRRSRRGGRNRGRDEDGQEREGMNQHDDDDADDADDRDEGDDSAETSDEPRQDNRDRHARGGRDRDRNRGRDRNRDRGDRGDRHGERSEEHSRRPRLQSQDGEAEEAEQDTASEGAERAPRDRDRERGRGRRRGGRGRRRDRDDRSPDRERPSNLDATEGSSPQRSESTDERSAEPYVVPAVSSYGALPAAEPKAVTTHAAPSPVAEPEDTARPKRKGWWNLG